MLIEKSNLIQNSFAIRKTTEERKRARAFIYACTLSFEDLQGVATTLEEYDGAVLRRKENN